MEPTSEFPSRARLAVVPEPLPNLVEIVEYLVRFTTDAVLAQQPERMSRKHQVPGASPGIR